MTIQDRILEYLQKGKTITALECYKRGCNCVGCFYSDFFSATAQKCQMKASVLELVRVLGKPDVELKQVLTDD